MPRRIATLAKGRTAIASLLVLLGFIAYIGGIATMPFYLLALCWPPIGQLLMFPLGLAAIVCGYFVYNRRRAWINVLATIGSGAVLLAINFATIAVLFRGVDTSTPGMTDRAAPLCLVSAVFGVAAMVYASRKRRTLNASA